LQYKVFIPCAGIGSRLDRTTKGCINKALIAVNHKPVISHIVEKFPIETDIVVALGYKGKDVKDFLFLAYPERNFTFIDIDLYEGPGSGKGHTLLCSKDHLQCPFIFITNDTIILDEIPEPNFNWVGACKNVVDAQYKPLEINNGMLVDIITAKKSSIVYTGVAGIKDFKIFWDALENGQNDGALLEGECFGIDMLLKKSKISVHYMNWYDTGNTTALESTRQILHDDSIPTILEKTGEFIWFCNNKVIKFSHDEDFIKCRVDRCKYLQGYVPNVISSTDHMYAYDMIPGERLSNNVSLAEFDELLNWLEDFWQPVHLDAQEQNTFYETCLRFYRDKTYQRVQKYLNRFSIKDSPHTINGHTVKKIFDILDETDWDMLSYGVATRFHGDLHLENILINRHNQQSSYKLLDWRQSFGGLLEYGDIYYDFSKILHGLVLSDELMHQGHYNIVFNKDQITLDVLCRYIFIEIEKRFKSYIRAKGYNYDKIKLLNAIIYLNMACLHEEPYAHFLYYFGKYLLSVYERD